MLCHPAGALIVKHLEGEARHHPLHAQPPSTGWVQRGGVDEHRVLAAIVHPDAIRLTAQHDAETNFIPYLLDTAGAVASTTTMAVKSMKTRCAAAAKVIAAAEISVGVELAEAEACALR